MPTPAARTAFALTTPGLGGLLAGEARRAGLTARRLSGDRRADVVGLAGPLHAIRRLRIAEDICLTVDQLRIRDTARSTAAVDPRGIARVLGGLPHDGGPRAVTRRRGVRVVVRLADERNFTRTALRAAVERRLGSLLDPGEGAHELWVLQTGPAALHVGIRVEQWSRRTTRTHELPGSLRPAVGAAMVSLAQSPRRMLDPCCGSGTILAEACATGCHAVGGDIDERARRAAAMNAPAPLFALDARRLPFRSRSFDAVVTNLPFGRQHEIPGSPAAWYRGTLSEAVRVAPVVVVLAPPDKPFRQALGRLPVDLAARHDIVVLGRRASIWVVHARGRP